ncbi:MAG: GDSL-type esterase/lipase family protein, partial [Lachnospiraceae bacterium]|nr:GDSL-type esterase/lipase family protein [Lachnospiraceae bacterium]
LSEKAEVTKNGRSRIQVMPGEVFWSDEFAIQVSSLEDFEISIYFKERYPVKTVCVTWAAQTWNSRVCQGDSWEGEELSYEKVLPFLARDIHPCRAAAGLCAVAVNTDADVKTVAVFGDSITHMSYYSDPLTKMLFRRYPGKITVINGGIGGNRLIGDAPWVEDMPGHGRLFGDAGVKRIEKDLYSDTVPDVVFCMEGVNDCTHSFAFQEKQAPAGEDLWNGLEKLISIVHGKGSKIYVSTVMPFGCLDADFREKAEQIRLDFNERIRTQCSADGVIDLDQVMRRDENPHLMRDGMHLGDGVHLNAAGGRKVAETILLPLLEEKVDFLKEEHLAVPLFENPIDYPVKELAEMCRLAFAVRECENREERQKLQETFVSMRKDLEVSYRSKSRIFLWPEGKMPRETVYTENPDYRYFHDPDFEPFLLEMLLPESETPKGALLTIAGGEHGMNTLNECYQVCLDFNEKGYQCFILNSRPNRGPWTGKECAADAARAVQYVRAHADTYRIDENRVILAGFSNGGIAVDECIRYYSRGQKVKDWFENYEPDALDAYDGSPNAQLCVYGARHRGTDYDDSSVSYPPTFFAVGRRDLAGVDNVNALYRELTEKGVPVEIHTFSGHPHGYVGWKIIDGIGNPNFDLWEDLADHFLQDAFNGK